jgi:hypothetical protein
MNITFNKKTLEIILRVGVFGTFLGHGVFALGVKTSWIPFLTVLGFTTDAAIQFMPIIGVLDIIVAVLALIKPMRVVFLYAFIWALLKSLIRPIVGFPIWDFVERASNRVVPLAILYLRGFPKTLKELFK